MKNKVTLGLTPKTYRRQFRNTVGNDVYTVVRDTVMGRTADEVSHATGMSVTSVAAVKANLSRGTYAPFVTLNTRAWTVDGLCDFGV